MLNQKACNAMDMVLAVSAPCINHFVDAFGVHHLSNSLI